jgi:hypothetical protein
MVEEAPKATWLIIREGILKRLEGYMRLITTMYDEIL